jgi:hypothetical protein
MLVVNWVVLRVCVSYMLGIFVCNLRVVFDEAAPMQALLTHGLLPCSSSRQGKCIVVWKYFNVLLSLLTPQSYDPDIGNSVVK